MSALALELLPDLSLTRGEATALLERLLIVAQHARDTRQDAIEAARERR